MLSSALSRRLRRSLALAASLALSPWAAQAAVPFGTLTFLQPTGTVQDTDTIDVWVRLTLDAASEPLSIVGGQPQWAYSPSDFNRPWSPEFYIGVDSVYINTFFTCSGTFTNGCPSTPGAPYTFDFNTSGPDSINFQADFNLAPGGSYDYLFGSFKPVGGVAPAGTYTFYNSGTTVGAYGSGYRAQQNPDGSLVYDTDGNVVYEPELDADGNPVLDPVQTPVYVPVLDGDGNPVFDLDGKPVYEQAIDPDTGGLLYDTNGNPVPLQATDPDTGELLFITTYKPRPAVFTGLSAGSATLAENGCDSFNPGSCVVFTREVVTSAVPEASTLNLSVAGLLMMGLALSARHRRG